ncbi:hypothetical protein GQX73_g3071 [Xylaria multiplex]|uniref:CMP/dCMP-type deaminase domain-containing protein n=1 Tax=Xylaria multiplex TaxID=323545 RepID=A0A7C8MPN9_9PEZI|nr:hypothetical protein GQX73_g3071 [Xylaria multiplex]
MAGHIFSRYVLNLWSALFAPFNFLFTRIWRFVTQAIEKKDIAFLPPSSKPSSPSLPLPSPSLSPSLLPSPPSALSTSLPTSVIPDAAIRAIPTTEITPTLTYPPATQSSFPLGLHDQNSSPSIVGEDLSDHTATNGLDDEGNDNVLSEGYQQHQLVDMTRKRAGRGRGGAKPSIYQATTVAPVTPVSPAAPASTGQSDSNASGDTSFTPNGPKSTSFKRGGNRARNRNSAIPQQQPIDTNKENVAPTKRDDNTISYTAHLDSPTLTPLAVLNTSEPQKSGTRSDIAVDSVGTTPTISTVCDESSTSRPRTEQLHVIADRLTLEDAPSPRQLPQQTLDEATATAEASALPVPLVVAVPILPQLQATQPEPQTPPPPGLPGLIEPTTDEERAEREYHLVFMRAALDMGDLALKTNETPVGCVLVYRGRVIARGMNATNITRNGTRHAEFMALSALLSRRQSDDVAMADINPDVNDASWGDVDPKDGHIYPYGQKLHPAPVVDRSIISECVLYVTVEPCVMCASLLRQLGIKKVYFGAVNDKFGGTGGVFRVHMNSKPVPIPKDRPYQQGYGPHDLNLISKGRAVAIPREDDEGDGGNVEPGYPVEGGYLRDDAVSLLRRFYVQENGRAPQPRKKEGRAARLYAAMENQNRTNTSDFSDNAPETPVEAEAPMALGGKPEPAISVVCV